MARLSLSLLGPFRAVLDEEPVTAFESNKVRALLAYLAVEADRPHGRERLADLLWSERSDQDAIANLRYALSNLRAAIDDRASLPPFLLISRQTIQFNRTSDAWVDVMAFTELLASPAPSLSDLEQAVALYQGEFLEGFFVGDSVAFEEWALLKREQFGRQVRSALHRLAAMHEERGEYERALPYAWRQVELDPWWEQACRQLMRLLALSGQRAAALTQYEAFRRALAEELGVEPASATTALYEQIRDGAAELLLSPTAHPLEPPPQPPAFLGEEETQPRVERPLFVARQRELARLDTFLDLALAGHGQVVFVTGEAGTGKTALLAEFARQAEDAHADLVVAGGSGVAYTGIGDPYHPFREVLSLLTGEVEAWWRAGAMTGERARRLWNTLPLACAALVAEGPDLVNTLVAGKALAGRARACALAGADWLAELEALVERKAASPAGAGPPQAALFAQYARVLLSLAQRVVLLLVLDDLQWADAGSISLLFHLGRQLGGSRILAVGAYRPEEVASGRGGERHPLEAVVNEFRRDLGDVMVNLDQVAGREFVDVLLDSEPNRLEVSFRDTLYRQTGGHPLFTVELLRGMQERGDLVQDQEGRWVEGPTLDWQTLPARVEAVIAGRIGRLPEPLQSVLRAASVEGETFTAEVVARMQAAGERETARWLSDLDRKHRLISGQGVQRVGGQRLSRQRFRHILFQRYLYNSLDEVERVRLHEDIGSALEALYEPGTRERADLAPQLAWHFQQAGNVEKAIDYLRQAGERAVRMSANEEVVAHLTQALALLETLPDTTERAQSELMLQACLIVPLQVLRGYGDPEVGRACARARELCQQMGESPQVFSILWLLAIFHGTRGENLTVHELTEQLLGMARRSGDTALIVMASFACGWNQVQLGNPAQAQKHFERVTANYDSQRHRHLIYGCGQDVAVSTGAFESWVLWLLGYPDQALQRSQEALAQAPQLEHPPSLAVAQGLAATFHMLRRDARAVLELSEALVRFSTKHGFEYWLQTGIFHRGWALAEQGEVAEGIAQMREGMARLLATGARLQHPLASSCLGRAYGKMGKAEEGLALLDEALESARRNSGGFVRAEIHRVRGELLSLRGAEAEAEADFHKAIEVARQQSAKSWELRAAVSLCRLWQKQGRRKQAHKELAEIYGWFTEGFDTPDLQEAKALLEELA